MDFSKDLIIKKLCSILLCLTVVCTAVCFAAEVTPENETDDIIYVTTTTELQTAMKNAQPGDEIVIAAGTYTGKLGANYSGYGSAFFNSDSSGTSEQPIILRSESSENKASLIGTGTGTGYALRITGDYWQILDINIGTAQKGVMLDNANYCLISGCDVTNVGQEGIHLRDGSSNNTVQNCTVSNTGLQSASFGEGIYIGSANGSWSSYAAACDNNTVTGCTLGPGIAAEHFDIKEGTTGTTVTNCTMNGTGISGANYADSFIDIKGDNVTVSGNIFYRNENSTIIAGIQVHNQIDTWGQNADIFNNTFYMDIETGYIIDATHDTTAKAANNTRVPVGEMYTGEVTEYFLSDLSAEISIDTAEPIIGDTVNITAVAVNGEGEKQCRITAEDTVTGESATLCDYGDSFSAQYNITALDEIIFTVYIKDQTGYVASAQKICTPKYAEIQITGVTLNGSTVNVCVKGGSGNAQYSCYVLCEGKIVYKTVRSQCGEFNVILPESGGRIRVYAEDSGVKCAYTHKIEN